MKLRLLRRRLTISSPRMAIRSALPWPLRMALVAAVLGFSATVGLWVFEFGSTLAGLDKNAKAELAQLRSEVARLRAENDKTQSVLNISGSLLTSEKAAQEKMSAQIKQLEADNRMLRDDLGFFEKLLPTGGGETVAIRGLQAEMLSNTQLKWQVLVIQPIKNAPNFSGKLELSFSGLQDGKPWTMTLPGGPQPLQFRQYRRLEGILDLPERVVVKSLTCKIIDGTAVRSVQTLKL